MPLFTSWDANVFLCLLSFGLPWDLVKEMVKMVKITHENFVEDEIREWYCNISPSLLYKKHKLGRWNFSVLARTPNKDVISEFKLAWQWRCPEVRRDAIYRLIMFQDISYIDRLKYDFDPLNGRYTLFHYKEKPKKGRYHSSEGLWNLWSAWNNYHNNYHDVISGGFLGNVRRKQHIADWYKNIHEGRYFLFFQENSLTGYGRRKSKDISISEKVKRFGSIHSIGPYEQVAEDLLVLDGPGLGKGGSKIEHIDDLFLD
jgi:hypothetical protein